LQNSPLESSCVVVALIENSSTSKPLKVSPSKFTDFHLTLLSQKSDMYTYTILERESAEGTIALASVWLPVTIIYVVSNDNYPFQLQELLA